MVIGITGSTGGLGRRFVELLLEKKYSLKLLIRQKPNPVCPVHERITVITGDITNPGSLVPFVTGLDVCIHFAAQVDPASRKQYDLVNRNGTENLCRVLLAHNPSCRFIHCSSISTLRVNLCCRLKYSFYALSKYDGEQAVLKHKAEHGLKATIIYPGIIFGGYDRYVFPGLIRGLQEGTIRLLKGGEKKAPFIYVDDLCNLFLQVLENPISIDKRYVSVKGLDLGVHDIIRIVAEKLGYPVPRKIHSTFIQWVLLVSRNLIRKIFNIKGKPRLNYALVDILSSHIGKYKKVFDDPETDLHWKQATARECVIQNIDHAIAFIKDRRQ